MKYQAYSKYKTPASSLDAAARNRGYMKYDAPIILDSATLHRGYDLRSIEVAE